MNSKGCESRYDTLALLFLLLLLFLTFLLLRLVLPFVPFFFLFPFLPTDDAELDDDADDDDEDDEDGSDGEDLELALDPDLDLDCAADDDDDDDGACPSLLVLPLVHRSAVASPCFVEVRLLGGIPLPVHLLLCLPELFPWRYCRFCCHFPRLFLLFTPGSSPSPNSRFRAA